MKNEMSVILLSDLKFLQILTTIYCVCNVPVLGNIYSSTNSHIPYNNYYYEIFNVKNKSIDDQQNIDTNTIGTVTNWNPIYIYPSVNDNNQRDDNGDNQFMSTSMVHEQHHYDTTKPISTTANILIQKSTHPNDLLQLRMKMNQIDGYKKGSQSSSSGGNNSSNSINTTTTSKISKISKNSYKNVTAVVGRKNRQENESSFVENFFDSLNDVLDYMDQYDDTNNVTSNFFSGFFYDDDDTSINYSNQTDVVEGRQRRPPNRPTRPPRRQRRRRRRRRQQRRGRYKIKKKYKKFLLPLLLAYKLKFFALVPLMMGGLVLLAGSTGMAGFFFALFAAVMGLKHKHT